MSFKAEDVEIDMELVTEIDKLYKGYARSTKPKDTIEKLAGKLSEARNKYFCFNTKCEWIKRILTDTPRENRKQTEEAMKKDLYKVMVKFDKVFTKQELPETLKKGYDPVKVTNEMKVILNSSKTGEYCEPCRKFLEALIAKLEKY